MAISHELIKGRQNLYNVDPRGIVVDEGWNQRQEFNGMEELKASIIQTGVLVPLIIKKANDQLRLIDGERRLRATLQAITEGHDIKTVPCKIAEKGISDKEAMFLQILANDGLPFKPFEEAEAYRKLVSYGIDIQEIATRVGRSRQHVYARLKLVNAGQEIRDAVESKDMTLSSAVQMVKDTEGDLQAQKVKVAEVKATPPAKRKPRPKPLAVCPHCGGSLRRSAVEEDGNGN